MLKLKRSSWVCYVVVILAVLIASTTLLSCSPQFHLDKANKHQQKALNKGAKFDVQIDTLEIHDTIIKTRTFTINDTVYKERTKTVKVVVKESGEIRYITKRDKRKEHRLSKKVIKLENKLKKKDHREASKQKRKDSKNKFKLDKLQKRLDAQVEKSKNRKSWWWLWLSIGIALALLLKPLLTQGYLLLVNRLHKE